MPGLGCSRRTVEDRYGRAGVPNLLKSSGPDLVGVALLFALLVRRDDAQARAHQYDDTQSHPASSVLVRGFGAI